METLHYIDPTNSVIIVISDSGVSNVNNTLNTVLQKLEKIMLFNFV